MGRYAIFIVLALIISLGTYGYGLQSTFSTSGTDAIDFYNKSQARNIAQSAALVAIQKLVVEEDEAYQPEEDDEIQIPASADSSLAWDDMGGNFRYTIQNLGDTLVIIQSTGMYRTDEYSVDVVLAYGGGGWDPDLPHAVFAETSILMTGSARIVGHAGTNSTAFRAVDLAWSTGIDSSLQIGPGGDHANVVREANFQNGNVGGEITNLPAPKLYPLPDYPDYPAKVDVQSSMIVSSWPVKPPIYPSDYDGKYFPELRITSNAVLTMHVGSEDRVLHVGNLNIQQGHINIIGTGKLTIYAETNITLNGSSTVNNNDINRNENSLFMFYGGSNSINFAGNTRFKGGAYIETANLTIGGSGGISGPIITGGTSVIVSGNAEAHSRVLYAPNAFVQLNGSGRVRGSVIADRFSAVGNTRVFYTNQFNSQLPTFGGGAKKLAVRRWR